jgi:hypothetical protein
MRKAIFMPSSDTGISILNNSIYQKYGPLFSENNPFVLSVFFTGCKTA